MRQDLVQSIPDPLSGFIELANSTSNGWQLDPDMMNVSSNKSQAFLILLL